MKLTTIYKNRSKKDFIKYCDSKLKSKKISDKNFIYELSNFFKKKKVYVKNFAGIKGANGIFSFDCFLKTRPSYFSNYYYDKKNKTNKSIIALNVYDIQNSSTDISAALKASSKSKKPIIFQISLNAGFGKFQNFKQGYLKLKEGPKTYVNCLMDNIIIHSLKEKAYPFGIGLDHVGGMHDQKEQSAKIFLQEALKTKLITHVTIDGTHKINFKERENKKKYFFCIKYILDLLKLCKEEDIEICFNELNYKDKNYNIPNSKTVEELFKLFDKANKTNLKMHYKPKLYVSNIGSIHHSTDKQKLDLSKNRIWNKLGEKYSFISNVLHGTTGLSNKQIIKSSKEGILKINIAGKVLKFFDLKNKKFNQNEFKYNFKKKIFLLSKKEKNVISKKITNYLSQLMKKTNNVDFENLILNNKNIELRSNEIDGICKVIKKLY